MQKQFKKISIPCKFYSLLGAGLIVIGVLLCVYGSIYDARFALALGISTGLFGIFVACIHGYCCTEDEGIAVKMPGKEKRIIYYDDINWVYLDVSAGSRSSHSLSRPLIYTIKIITDTETFNFKLSHGKTSSSDELFDARRKEFLLMQSPFREMEKMIKEKKGMIVEPDIERLLR